jgi:16S rRNA (cytosine967-C5)-methyltransferase
VRPSARIQTSIELLEKIAKARIPMDAVTGDYFRVRRYIGSKDRAAIVQRVYDITRAHARLRWHLEQVGSKAYPRSLVIAFMVLGENMGEQQVKDLFDGGQYAPEPLAQEEIAILGKLRSRKLDDKDMPLAVRVECPPQYEEVLKNYFGDDFESEMQAMITSAPLDLRVNAWGNNREEVKKSLAKDGIETSETPYSPWGLRAKGKAFVSKSKAFHKGMVSIQDEGSQLIAHVCDAKPGQQVLDYCAGGGGKTLALAAAMQRKGRIVAMDNDERRLEKGRERYKKAGVSDIIEVRPLSDERHRKWLRRQKETFDIVLLDVPCSGTGTWRRNPDSRWDSHAPPTDELLKTQAEILEKTAGTVKPGGKLIYATCSLLPAENEEQMETFLKAHPEFTVKPVDEKLGDKYMRLTPKRHDTDAFFAAVLEKKSAA